MSVKKPAAKAKQKTSNYASTAVATKHKPSAEAKKPSVEAKKPSAEAKKPSVEAKKRSIEAKKPLAEAKELTRDMDARSNKEDRREDDRRHKDASFEVERRSAERRVKVSRRRQIDPTTCERDYSPREIEFMSAMDSYKRRSGRMFPTCSEILEVIEALGYEKRAELPTVALPVVAVTFSTVTAEQAV